MRALLAVLALASVALAGCSDKDDSENPLPTGTDGPWTGGNGTMGPPQVFYGNGTISFAAGTPVVSFQSGASGAEATVRDNATLVLAELKWDGPVDLDLLLSSPSAGEDPAGNRIYDHRDEDGNVGSPDSPAIVTVAKPEDGTWTAVPFAKGGSAATDFTLAVTVFYGETEVPEGYTALA